MADETGTTPRMVSTSRVASEKEANRIAAAKAYIAAMKKAGQEVPESVKELANIAQEAGNMPTKVPGSRVMSKKEANRIAAAKVYIAAMKKAGEEVPDWIHKLAQQGS